MGNKMRQSFTPGGKFIVSRTFRFHGKVYKKGDEFPWRQLSCSVRKLRTLYEGRRLNNVYVDEKITPEQETVVEPITMVEDEEIVEEVVEETPNDEVDQLTVFDPEIHEIINPDRGEWYIVLGDERLTRLTAKEAKRLRKRLVPTDINLDKVVTEE